VSYWLAASILLSLLSLAAARYLTSPHWVDALVATGGSLGLVCALVTGLLLRRWLGRDRWLGPAALLVALGAAFGRAHLLARIATASVPSIDFPRLALAASTVVWGAVALLWGTLALADALAPRRPLPALGAAVAVALALYSVAPLLYLLGLKVNHWTVLGLFGLSAVAYGMGRLWRLLARSRERTD
jgi:hypothetical protein